MLNYFTKIMFISFSYYYYILNLHVVYIIINGNLKYLFYENWFIINYISYVIAQMIL